MLPFLSPNCYQPMHLSMLNGYCKSVDQIFQTSYQKQLSEHLDDLGKSPIIKKFINERRTYKLCVCATTDFLSVMPSIVNSQIVTNINANHGFSVPTIVHQLFMIKNQESFTLFMNQSQQKQITNSILQSLIVMVLNPQSYTVLIQCIVEKLK